MSKLQNIYARVRPDILQELSALAEMRNQSISELIRKIVTDYFTDVVDTVTTEPLVLPYEYDFNDLEPDSNHHNTDDDLGDISDTDTVEAATSTKGLFADRPLADFDPDKHMAVNFVELDW